MKLGLNFRQILEIMENSKFTSQIGKERGGNQAPVNKVSSMMRDAVDRESFFNATQMRERSP